MTLGVFNITENMQASVRDGTRCHPGEKSLGIFISVPSMHATHSLDDPTPPPAIDMSAYDAVGWDRAVAFAKWILSFDEGADE